MTLFYPQEQKRYQELKKRGECFEAFRVVGSDIDLTEGRRVFPWEWMAQQHIEGKGESIYDQLQAVLDAEALGHHQVWLLMRPGFSNAGMTWKAETLTFLGYDVHRAKLNLAGSSFARSTFKNVCFGSVDLLGAHFDGCVFSDCDFGFICAPESMRRCTFYNCRMNPTFQHFFDPALLQKLQVQPEKDFTIRQGQSIR